MQASRDSEGYLFQPSDWDEDVARYQYLTEQARVLTVD